MKQNFTKAQALKSIDDIVIDKSAFFDALYCLFDSDSPDWLIDHVTDYKLKQQEFQKELQKRFDTNYKFASNDTNYGDYYTQNHCESGYWDL